MKLTTLLFGLLLAVGWTSNAQAQLKAVPLKFQPLEQIAPSFEKPEGQALRAPLRADETDPEVAPAIHPRSFYEGFTYTWSGGESKITEPATDPDQMANLVKYIYTKKEIPGIKYSAAQPTKSLYPNIEFGYNIAQASTSSTSYSDIYVYFPNSLFNIYYVAVYSGSSTTPRTYWQTGSVGGNANVNWSYSNTLTQYNNGYYYFNGGGYFRVPASAINGYSNIRVVVRGYFDSNTDEDGNPYTDYQKTMRVNHQPQAWTTSVANYEFSIRPTQATGTVTPPDENGYTTLIVKVKDFKVQGSPDYHEFDLVNDEFTFSWDDITTYFKNYVQSIELLTDGMRVSEGTESSGTVFAYQGILDKFYFISKGKMYSLSSLESSYPTDRAPFYSMYEEFSPYTPEENTNQTDLYSEMRAGEYYPVQHDCQGVIWRDHYFSMQGKNVDGDKSVAPIILYIPDYRGRQETARNYDQIHQPQVGLYTINLAAETEPAEDYDPNHPEYTVYLDWTSSLDQMVKQDVDQTYYIYKVTYDEQGNPSYEKIGEVENQTTWHYNEPQLQTSQTFTYVIMGFPTDATNNPVKQPDGGIFWVYSNLDDVQIPGLFDFMVLYRERYESDFVIKEEKNYYRNYLYPTNLAAGTGMTMGQLKQEWPDQTASYTLWRSNEGVAKLEVRGIGNKVYYRIRYIKNTQVTTGPNADENTDMPYNYVEITND